MKFLKLIVKALLIIIVLAIVLTYVTGNEYLFKALRTTYLRGHTTASIDDFPFFHRRIILNDVPNPWEKASNYLRITKTLREHLEKHKTAAFLVVQNGKILFEEYWSPYNETSKTNSFSMTKTLVTNLLAAAIQDGYIKGLDQPISDFFPRYKKGLGSKVTVGDLSTMSSGLEWQEEYYLPINVTTKAYFGRDLDSLILGLPVVEEPGKKFVYLSGSTQLLSLVLKKATGKNPANYLSEKFWQPMGMNDDAFWALDEDGEVEKAFCCVYSNARNFAKFGQLYLQKGNWEGKQLIDTTFIEKFTTPVFSPEYGYSWWINKKHAPAFYSMTGHQGQYVIVVPDHNLVIVRLGEKKDEVTPGKDKLPPEPYIYIDEVMKMLLDT